MPKEIKASGRGGHWGRSVDAAKLRVRDNEEYFIKRGHSGWFRAAAHGYTDDLCQAGRFLGKDARGYLGAEGVVLVPVDAMSKMVWKEVKELIERAAKLSAIFERY